RDGEQIDLALRPWNGEPTLGEDYLSIVGLQQMSRHPAALLDDHLRRFDQSRPALMHRAGAAVTGAALHHSRIGLDEAKRIERQPEQRGGDLRVTGLVSLAVRLGAEDQQYPAIKVEVDFGGFVRCPARRLKKASDPKAAQPAARRRSGAARLKLE